MGVRFITMTKKLWRPTSGLVFMMLCLVASVGLNVYLLLINPKSIETPGVQVVGVIDGDTLVVESKAKVRLRFVDAPELAYCGGQEAKQELEKLVLGKTIVISEQIPDQFGRAMALVYVGNTLINEEMLKSGWVRYHHDTSALTDRMKAAFASVKDKKLGIFRTCQSKDSPDDPKCTIKGNIDDNSGKKTYYVDSCAQYKFTVVEKDQGESWFCTEKEAVKAGYVKAETCK